jgi:hypothetical protein
MAKLGMTLFMRCNVLVTFFEVQLRHGNAGWRKAVCGVGNVHFCPSLLRLSLMKQCSITGYGKVKRGESVFCKGEVKQSHVELLAK